MAWYGTAAATAGENHAPWYGVLPVSPLSQGGCHHVEVVVPVMTLENMIDSDSETVIISVVSGRIYMSR